MASLKEAAESYVDTAKTKNIADLSKVSVTLNIESKTLKDKNGEEFTLDYVTIDGEQYRVPRTVLKSLKIMLEDNPSLSFFRVKKTGAGLDTEYTVIPLL